MCSPEHVHVATQNSSDNVSFHYSRSILHNSIPKSFPSLFHFLYPCFPSKSLGICAFSDHHIVDLSDYVHSPNVVMQPIIQFVSLLLMSIISLLDRYRLGGSLLVRVVRHSLLQPTQLTVNSRAMEQGGRATKKSKQRLAYSRSVLWIVIHSEAKTSIEKVFNYITDD